jgi:hypothetical protein
VRQATGWMLSAAFLTALGCGDGGTAPPGDNDGQRLASQFERLADSVDDAGYSPTAEALRHAAEIVRLTGHATPVTLSIDGTTRHFLAVAEQLDIPNLICTWPSDSGIVPPGDTVVVPPGGTGSGTPPDSAVTAEDSLMPPPMPGEPGECHEAGTFSMRTLIAWEPETMAEVVRIVADLGTNGVEVGVPDVMTGLPTNASPAEAPPTAAPPDSSTGGGGDGWTWYPGFIGEYLVRDAGTWFAVEGSQTNALEDSGGACSSDHATFDWAEFSCLATRLRFEFAIRVEPLRAVPLPEPLPEETPPPDQPEGDHAIAMTATSVDGVRLTVVGWTPPPAPVPGPLPPDSSLANR